MTLKTHWPKTSDWIPSISMSFQNIWNMYLWWTTFLSVKSGEIYPGGIKSLIFHDSTQTDSNRFQYHVQDNKWPISLRCLCYRFGIMNCSLDTSFLSAISMTRFKSSLLSRERIMMGTFSASTRRSFALQNKLSFGLHQRYPYILVLIRHRQLVRSCSCRSLCGNVQTLWAFWSHYPLGQFRSAESQRHYRLIWWDLWLLPSEAFALLEWFDSEEVFSGLRRRLRLEQMHL
jgi:hypothetical protein